MRKVFSSIGEYFRQTDKLLLLLCLLATGYGLVLLLVAGQANDMKDSSAVLATVGGLDITMQFVKQFASVVLGVLAALIISAIDYEILAACWWILAPISVILVVLTYFIGMDTGAADDKAWLMIPGIGMTFQPSELLKIAFIITFSLHLYKTRDRLNSPLNLLLLCIHGAVPVGMIMLQGDDGTALVFLFIFVVMLFVAGIKLRYFVIGGVLAAIAAPILWFYVLQPFQRDRFTIFLHPENARLDEGYQQYQSRMIIGSGQLTGKGIADSGQINLPERQNDFIFSVSGETFGFIGSVLVIAILIAIILRVFLVSRKAKDMLGSLMCMGMFATLTAQTILNVGMNICLMPVVGVTLPFFSAGGSSTTTLYLGIGLVLSVYIHSKPKTHTEELRRRRA